MVFGLGQKTTVHTSCWDMRRGLTFCGFPTCTMRSATHTRFLAASPMVVGFWLVAVVLLGPVPASSEGVSLTITPERTNEPREGDSVVLVCRVTAPARPDAIFWKRENSTFADDTGLNQNADGRLSLDPVAVVDATGPVHVFSQRVTIGAVRESDEASYSCETAAQTSATRTLEVHPAAVFPVCSHYGRATVRVGDTLSCGTVNESRTPAVTVPRMPEGVSGWTSDTSTAGPGPGSELTHAINTSDNGTTFTCFAITRVSRMTFSCSIGPLTVAAPDDATADAGLSSADVAGIVVGSVLLLLLVALHLFCCRCSPRRWTRAKSYLLDLGSSFYAASTRPDGSAPDRASSAELGGVAPPSSEATTGSDGAGSVSDSPADQPATCELRKAAPGQPEQGVDARVDVTSPSSSDAGCHHSPIYDNARVRPVATKQGTDSGAGPGPRNQKIKRFAVNRRGKMTDKPLVPDAAVSVSGATDGGDFRKDPSVIYAKVDKAAKRSPRPADAGEDSGSGKISKKIKRFALNRKNKARRAAGPPKPEPAIAYAELDLPEAQSAVRPPTEPPTEYAEIRR